MACNQYEAGGSLSGLTGVGVVNFFGSALGDIATELFSVASNRLAPACEPVRTTTPGALAPGVVSFPRCHTQCGDQSGGGRLGLGSAKRPPARACVALPVWAGRPRSTAMAASIDVRSAGPTTIGPRWDAASVGTRPSCVGCARPSACRPRRSRPVSVASSGSTVRRWEAGRHVPLIRQLEAIADAFDIDLAVFFEPANPGRTARRKPRRDSVLPGQIELLPGRRSGSSFGRRRCVRKRLSRMNRTLDTRIFSPLLYRLELPARADREAAWLANALVRVKAGSPQVFSVCRGPTV